MVAKFIDYNIKDVELVDRLEDKMRLLELALTMAYDAKVSFEDVYSRFACGTPSSQLSQTSQPIVPPKKRANKDEKYAGAYVKELSRSLRVGGQFDLNSLYPHLIMQYNISPETLVETKHPSATVERLLNREIEITGDYAVCANGAQYHKDIHGFYQR